MSKVCTKLHTLNLALAMGATWALGVFLLGLSATFFNWGGAMVTDFGSVYFGYKASFLGSIIGAIWGFCDGFIGGFFIALFYNLFSKGQCAE